MEAFENWNKDNEGYYPLLEATMKSERCKGFVGALEWVLSRVETSNSDGSIIQDIKNELKS